MALKSKARRRRIELSRKRFRVKAKLHSKKTRRKKTWVAGRKR